MNVSIMSSSAVLSGVGCSGPPWATNVRKGGGVGLGFRNQRGQGPPYHQAPGVVDQERCDRKSHESRRVDHAVDHHGPRESRESAGTFQDVDDGSDADLWLAVDDGRKGPPRGKTVEAALVLVLEDEVAVVHDETLRARRIERCWGRLNPGLGDVVVRDRAPGDVNRRDVLADLVDGPVAFPVARGLDPDVEAVKVLVYVDADKVCARQDRYVRLVEFLLVRHREAG